MTNFVTIFTDILSPIFLIIFIGFFLQKKLKLDLKPFAKIQIYMCIPALLFINIATSQLQGTLIFQIISFTIILFIILMILSIIIARLFGMSRKKEKAFINAVTLRNQGNFGIPLITLAFAAQSGNPLSIHMIALFTTSLLLHTVGLYNTSSGTYTKNEAIKQVLKLPILYAILVGFIFKVFQLAIPSPFETSINIIASAVVPLALFTLGAQLANMPFKFTDFSLAIAVFLRLILSPVIAWAICMIFGFSDLVSQVLILGAATPTAVNSVLLALEFEGDAEYASQTVFLTTLFSAITVTIAIQMII